MTQRQAVAVRMIETLDEKYCDKVITYIEFLQNEARQENLTDSSLSLEIASLFSELEKGENLLQSLVG